MLIMKDNKIGPARVKVSSSPSYTLKEIEALGLQYAKEAYVDDDDLTRELELSRFLAWLTKREREGLER